MASTLANVSFVNEARCDDSLSNCSSSNSDFIDNDWLVYDPSYISQWHPYTTGLKRYAIYWKPWPESSTFN